MDNGTFVLTLSIAIQKLKIQSCFVSGGLRPPLTRMSSSDCRGTWLVCLFPKFSAVCNRSLSFLQNQVAHVVLSILFTHGAVRFEKLRRSVQS